MIGLILVSCSNQELSLQEYISYIENSKKMLIQKKEFGDIIYELKFLPAEYRAIKNLSINKEKIEINEYKKQLQNYSSNYYFVLSFYSNSKDKSPLKTLAKNKEDLSKINQYLMAKIQNDLYLEIDGKKIPCSLSHSEGDYGILDHHSLSVLFDKTNSKSEDVTFVYTDNLFQNGVIKFNYSENVFNELPKVKL